MTDVFRRIGRGGAGNFYSKKDIEEVEKAKPQDLEAQQPSMPAIDASSVQSGAAYARAGRGGAGNFYDQAAAAETAEKEKEEAEKTKTIMSNLAAKPRTVLSGRGGVGNWNDSGASQVAQDEDKKAKDLEAQVLRDVDAGLAMPPRAYQQHDREMEK